MAQVVVRVRDEHVEPMRRQSSARSLRVRAPYTEALGRAPLSDEPGALEPKILVALGVGQDVIRRGEQAGRLDERRYGHCAVREFEGVRPPSDGAYVQAAPP
jgi:hypothetical protein